MVPKDLGCVIYTDAPEREIADRLSPILPRGSDVDIVRNLDFNATRRRQFPDGFLNFASRIEIHPCAAFSVSLDDHVRLVSAVLERLWSHGVSAVAACDYEDRLPEAGGYRSRTIPWPTRP